MKRQDFDSVPSSLTGTRVVYALDDSPEAIAAALSERERLTTYGLLGPIDPPMIVIPAWPQVSDEVH